VLSRAAIARIPLIRHNNTTTSASASTAAWALPVYRCLPGVGVRVRLACGDDDFSVYRASDSERGRMTDVERYGHIREQAAEEVRNAHRGDEGWMREKEEGREEQYG
jgi:hypothetical protein